MSGAAPRCRRRRAATTARSISTARRRRSADEVGDGGGGRRVRGGAAQAARARRRAADRGGRRHDAADGGGDCGEGGGGAAVPRGGAGRRGGGRQAQFADGRAPRSSPPRMAGTRRRWACCSTPAPTPTTGPEGDSRSGARAARGRQRPVPAGDRGCCSRRARRWTRRTRRARRRSCSPARRGTWRRRGCCSRRARRWTRSVAAVMKAGAYACPGTLSERCCCSSGLATSGAQSRRACQKVPAGFAA